jgi:6-phosphogluconolactonase (cycloisomerase 2 family)
MRRAFGLGIAAAVVITVLLVLSATAQAAGTVYVTSGYLHDPADSVVSQYAIGAGGSLSPLPPATLGGGVGDSSGRIVIAPNGKSAYIGCSRGLCQYDIDPLTGALSPKTPASVGTGHSDGRVDDMAMAPNGKWVYVMVNYFVSHFCCPTDIVQYEIDPRSGVLSPKTRFDGGYLYFGHVAVTPDSRSAYITGGTTGIGNQFTGVVSQYDINSLTGALSPKTPASVSTGFTYNPGAAAVTPDGRSAYFAEGNNIPGPRSTNPLAQFNIDPVSGVLSPKTPAILDTGLQVRYIVITPDGRSAYATSPSRLGYTGNGTVWQYDIDSATGALSPKTPVLAPHPVSPETVVLPVGIAVTPDSKNAYLTDFANSSVWQYRIDPQSGALTSPSAVATDFQPKGIAVGPLPRVPTTKDQCKHGGWRSFPQFKNQGRCVAFIARGT